MSTSQNYLVNVRCPHCKSARPVAISGFGGELATREKVCSKCGNPYFVHLVAQTSIEPTITDGTISIVKDRIKYLQDERRKTLAELLIKQEVCQALYRESLETARKMRDSYGSN